MCAYLLGDALSCAPCFLMLPLSISAFLTHTKLYALPTRPCECIFVEKKLPSQTARSKFILSEGQRVKFPEKKYQSA